MQLEDDALDPEPRIFVPVGRPHVNGPLVRFVILRTFTQPEGERSHNETFAQFLRFIALHRSAARLHQRRRAATSAPGDVRQFADYHRFATRVHQVSSTAQCMRAQ